MGGLERSQSGAWKWHVPPIAVASIALFIEQGDCRALNGQGEITRPALTSKADLSRLSRRLLLKIRKLQNAQKQTRRVHVDLEVQPPLVADLGDVRFPAKASISASGRRGSFRTRPVADNKCDCYETGRIGEELWLSAASAHNRLPAAMLARFPSP